MRVAPSTLTRPVPIRAYLLLLLCLLPGLTLAQTNAPSSRMDPVAYFLRHVSPHEPIYFVAGSESPNAKFQFGFKYQLVDEQEWLGKTLPQLAGFNFAYLQTSLWDMNAPSSPFLDTSYKPAFLYNWEHVAGRDPGDAFRLDLQTGLQHESNGRDQPDSRSLNYAYIRPTFAFGGTNDFRLTVQPRAWVYLGDLSDNPDIKEYRGYFDLRVIVAWRELELSTYARMGDEGQHQSWQFDLTYPCPWLSVYLQAQYFTGYGESLLYYQERSDVFRFGIALYR